MLNITHHQGNTNQNHDQVPPYPLPKLLKPTTQETTDVGKDVEKGEHSYTVSGNANCEATLENSMKVPQKVKNRTTL